MGDRGIVKVMMFSSKCEKCGHGKTYPPVFLYTHWSASELIENVKKALGKYERWDDNSYLARIIFGEMTKENKDGTSGYGIQTIEQADAWRTITVNPNNQTVIVEDNREIKFDGSFEEFIKWEGIE